MSDDELLRGGADDEDLAAEGALRPRSLAEFIGQERVRSQLGLVLEAARHRGSAPDHVLLSGPPGLGKTTLAMIIAQELAAPLRITSGPAIQHAGDLAAVLSSLAWTTIAADATGLGVIRIALAISWLALGFAKLGLMREVIRAQAYRTDSKEKE